MIQFDIYQFIMCFLAAMTAFIITVLIAPSFIPMLRRLKFGQEVRELGPESHLKKQGTPTMGGIMFLIAILAATIIGMVGMKQVDINAIKILFITMGFGAVGFADDFLKIKKKKSDGLMPKEKMALQFVITIAFAISVYMDHSEGAQGARVYVPFTGFGENALFINLPVWIYIPFVTFVILGTDNGVNFTDGLDGLCSSVTAAVAGLLIMIGLCLSIPGISITAAAVLGGLLGFLMYNVYPAKVFMGDTGSLSLGGFVAAAAVAAGLELYIPIFGFIYMIEVISVIIQVGYFKATKGKRFFKMAPIHHHFELLGNSETRIVAAFTIVTILLCAVSFIGIVR